MLLSVSNGTRDAVREIFLGFLSPNTELRWSILSGGPLSSGGHREASFMHDDAALVDRAKRGDSGAYEMLVVRYERTDRQRGQDSLICRNHTAKRPDPFAIVHHREETTSLPYPSARMGRLPVSWLGPLALQEILLAGCPTVGVMTTWAPTPCTLDREGHEAEDSRDARFVVPAGGSSRRVSTQPIATLHRLGS